MKKRLLSALTLLAVLLGLALPAAAAGEEYVFTLLANGKPSETVRVGEEVTVTLLLSRADGADFDLYSIQDYIRFDPEYLRFVEGSAETYRDAEGGTPLQAAPLKFSVTPVTEYNCVYTNRSGGDSAVPLRSGTVLLTFRLLALKAGTTDVTHDTVELFHTVGVLWSAAEENARIVIQSGDDPGPVDPGPVDPGPDDPGPVDPGPVDPGPVDPGPVDPGPDDPEPVDPVDPVKTLPFVDVNEDDWFYDAVYAVYDAGLFLGVDATHFLPYGDTTRGTMATVMHRLAGTPAYGAAAEYLDVGEKLWYTDAVYWATEAGVMIGYGDGNFGPDDLISREQFATVLWRYYGRPGSGVSLDSFPDGGTASPWAQEALCWAAEAGILTGRDGGLLAPLATATRMEIATMLARYLALSE